MEPRVGHVGRVFFVRWYVRATSDHIRRVMDAMIEARKVVGCGLVFVGIFEPDIGVPGDEIRHEIMRAMRIVDRICEAYFVALQGKGVARVLLRGAFEITFGLIRKPFTVVDTIEEAVSAAARAAGVDAAELLAEARALGITDDEATGRGMHA